jgi:DHA2 family multidrug resistance protein
LGLILMTVSFVAMQIVFEKGQDKGWFDSSLIVSCTIIAVVGILLFIWRELSVDKPVVDLSLFTDRNFICGTLVGAVFGFCLYSTLFLQPLFLQQLGYSANQTGMILMPRSLIMAIAMPLAGRLYNSWGARNIILIGLGITVCSYWQFSHLNLNVSGTDMIIPQLFQGMGFGMMFVALSTVILSTVPKPKMTSAVGLYNVTRQIMGSVGIAIGATLLSNGDTSYRNILNAHVTNYNPMSRQWIANVSQGFQHHGMNAFSAHTAAIVSLSAEVDRQAQMLSFNHIFILMAVVFIFSIPLMMTIQNKRPEGKITGLEEAA